MHWFVVALLLPTLLLLNGFAAVSANGPKEAGTLRVEVHTDSTVYRLGQPLALVMTVTHSGSEPVSVMFPTGQTFDFVVRRDGEPVWQWSAGRMFTQAIRHKVYEPGRPEVYIHVWDGMLVEGYLPPGDYEVVAVLAARQEIASAPVAFTVRE